MLLHQSQLGIGGQESQKRMTQRKSERREQGPILNFPCDTVKLHRWWQQHHMAKYLNSSECRPEIEEAEEHERREAAWQIYSGEVLSI